MTHDNLNGIAVSFRDNASAQVFQSGQLVLMTIFVWLAHQGDARRRWLDGKQTASDCFRCRAVSADDRDAETAIEVRGGQHLQYGVSRTRVAVRGVKSASQFRMGVNKCLAMADRVLGQSAPADGQFNLVMSGAGDRVQSDFFHRTRGHAICHLSPKNVSQHGNDLNVYPDRLSLFREIRKSQPIDPAGITVSVAGKISQTDLSHALLDKKRRKL